MSGVEDISDENNEDVDENEGIILSYEDQPINEETFENKPTTDSNDVDSVSVSLTNITHDSTAEDVVGKEKGSNDGEVGDDSKAGNSDSTLKVIAMCKRTCISCFFSKQYNPIVLLNKSITPSNYVNITLELYLKIIH